MEEKTKEHSEATARERGYESATPKIRIATISAVGLIVLVVASALLMAGMFYGLVWFEDARDPGPSPMLASRMPPVGPRLLPDNADQVNQLHAVEDSLLTTYGWVDRENGFVRIPVDRALALVASNGLPSSLSPGAQP